MGNIISNYRKALALCLSAFLLLSLLVSCSGSVNSTLSPPRNTLIQSSNVSIPDGTLFPFDDRGQLVWSTSDIKSIDIDYMVESAADYFITSTLSTKRTVQSFINQMNTMQKELVGVVKGDLDSLEAHFAEFNRGTELYRISVSFQYGFHLAFVSKAADYGYLWYRYTSESDRFMYYFSLYRIDLNDLKQLEQTFESYEKAKETLYAKPVLYLYPQDELDVRVELAYKGELTVTYPAYDGGWNVRAYPDGHLVNYADGLEYSYLFWEGHPYNKVWWNLDEGYCIPGADTVSFLQKALSELGLTPKEYNEFIVYWLPRMQDNPYNLISFQWEEYETIAPLIIDPVPDSMLRVFMVFAPLEKPIELQAPAPREPFVRSGFTVVEWGGTQIEYGK